MATWHITGSRSVLLDCVLHAFAVLAIVWGLNPLLDLNTTNKVIEINTKKNEQTQTSCMQWTTGSTAKPHLYINNNTDEASHNNNYRQIKFSDFAYMFPDIFII